MLAVLRMLAGENAGWDIVDGETEPFRCTLKVKPVGGDDGTRERSLFGA
jgi:hypothetical protein